ALTYSISDDMRGPLRAIDGFSRVLMEEYPERLDNEGRRLLNIVRGNAEQMARLIDGLLMFSHVGRQPPDNATLNTQELGKRAFDEVRSGEFQRDVPLKLFELPRARGDRTMIRQVFLALLSNAFKFTRRKAGATIEIGSSEAQGNQNVYYVRDNGIGF